MPRVEDSTPGAGRRARDKRLKLGRVGKLTPKTPEQNDDPDLYQLAPVR